MLLQLGDSCDCVVQSEVDEDGVPYYSGNACSSLDGEGSCGGSCTGCRYVNQAFVQDEVWVTSETSLVWYLARGSDQEDHGWTRSGDREQ